MPRARPVGHFSQPGNAARTQSRAGRADDRGVKPTASASSTPSQTSPAPGKGPSGKPRLPLAHGFGERLAAQRGLGGPPPAGRAGERVSGRERGRTDGTADGREAPPKPPRERRVSDADDPSAIQQGAEGAPFRPLPACVFAPSGGRASPLAPKPPEADVTRLANELLRSLHIGGERGRGRVRLVLDPVEHGEALQIELEETASGVVATLPVADDARSQRLVRAIERELRRRGVEVVEVGEG